VKYKESHQAIKRLIVFLGARPQTPWVGFAESRVANHFREAEQRFCFFLEKKNTKCIVLNWPYALEKALSKFFLASD
jgi:hypothetical protein